MQGGRKKKDRLDPWELACSFLSLGSPLRTREVEAAWRDWIQHRWNLKREALTPQAVKRNMRKLSMAKDAAEAVRWIEYSIERNWRGIFPPSEQADGRAAVYRYEKPSAGDTET